MKPFVRSNTRALDWRHGGRERRPTDLHEWMLPLAGLLFIADVFSLIQLPTVVEYLLAGIMLGSFTGKSIVVWREWGGLRWIPTGFGKSSTSGS